MGNKVSENRLPLLTQATFDFLLECPEIPKVVKLIYSSLGPPLVGTIRT